MENSTLQIVSNTSLSIFFGILVGVILAPIIAYADHSFRKNDAFTKTNYLLIVSWALVPVFTIYFAYTLFHEYYDTAKALAPFGMMIAAMIASASVMKNIAETKVNEETKHTRDIEKEDKKYAKEDSKFYLDKCVSYLEHVHSLLMKLQNDPFSWKDASETLIIMRNLSKKITEESHKEVFQTEYKKYSMRLYSRYATAIPTLPDGKYIPINSSFFCGIENWKDLDIDTSFNTNIYRIQPTDLITVLKFAQRHENIFLSETTDNSDWESINIDTLDQLPLKIAKKYLQKFKEKIAAKEDSQ